MKIVTNRQGSLIFIGCFLFLAAVQTASAAGLDAEMVIYNGKIITADSPDPKNFTTAQAAAIYGGKFVAVGKNEDVLQYAGPKTQKIDLGGRTVIPGLVETHDHIYAYATHFFPPDAPRVDVTDPPILWTNKTEFLAQLRTLALKKKPGEWIITIPQAFMGLVTELQRGDITRFDLDKIAPNNFMAITWNADNEALVNSKALDPLLARYPNIPGAKRDDKGVYNGRITGVALKTLEYEFWPQVPPKRLAPYYKMEMDEIAAQGMTTVSTRLSPYLLAFYTWLHARGELPVRMAYTSELVSRSPQPEALYSRMVGLQGGSGKQMFGAGDDKLWMIGVAAAYNIDMGSVNAVSCIRAVWPREAADFPTWLPQFYGPHGNCTLANPDYKDLDSVRAAAKYGFRITGLHDLGDMGIDKFLDVTEEMIKQYPEVAERRWSIDHCLMVHEDQVVRAKKDGVFFSCSPQFLYDGDNGELRANKILVGEKEAAEIVTPFRMMLDKGLRTVLELDRHAFHPFLALQVAVNRKDMNGKEWAPEQRIDRLEALYMYTRWSSEYVLKENLLGSIEQKRAADFAVLNRDYLTVPEKEIGRIDPVLTVMDGKITYSEPDFATSQGLPQIGYRGDRSGWWRGTPEDAKQRNRFSNADGGA